MTKKVKWWLIMRKLKLPLIPMEMDLVSLSSLTFGDSFSITISLHASQNYLLQKSVKIYA